MKNSIILTNRLLNSKNEIVYLGIIFSDTGRINNGVKVKGKRSDITMKYTNFCAQNYLAPFKIKLAVLHSCVKSSLSYSCETWGDVYQMI